MAIKEWVTTEDLAIRLLRFMQWEADVEKYRKAGKPGMAKRREAQAMRAAALLAEALAAYRLCHGKDIEEGERNGETHYAAI